MKLPEVREQLEQQLRALASEKQKTLDSLSVVAEPKKKKQVQELLQLQEQRQDELQQELQRVRKKELGLTASHTVQDPRIRISAGIGFLVMITLLITAIFQYDYSSSPTGLSVGGIPTVTVQDKDDKEVGSNTVELGEDGKYNLKIHIPEKNPDRNSGTSIAEAQEIGIVMEEAEIVQDKVRTKADYYAGTPPANGKLKTKVVSVEGVGKVKATIRLPKLGEVTLIFRCDDFNHDDFECAEWEITDIPFTDGGSYIEFVVDHFSAYAAGEIVAIDAVHLDSGYNFISNVFEQIKAVDDVWSEPIAVGEMVRTTFERNLTNGRVIDIFVRGAGMTQNAYVEVYEVGTNNLVGSSTLILSPDWKYITIGGLSKPMDVFDLRVTSEDPQARVEFDFIHDNIISPTQADGMAIWGARNNASAQYQFWNSSNQVALPIARANGVGTNATDDVRWTVLKATYKRDEMILGTLDSSTDTNVQVYNNTGRTWTPVTEVATAAATNSNRPFDIAYEDLSGDALIMYDNSATNDNFVQFRIWNGTRFSAQNNITMEDPGGVGIHGAQRWIFLYPLQKSDKIMALIRNQTADRLYGIPWDGDQFDRSQSLILSNTTVRNTGQSHDFAWEMDSGEGIATYSTTTNTIVARPYSPTTGWGNELVLQSGTTNGIEIKMCSDPESDYIGIIWQNAGNDINSSMWNGTEIIPFTGTVEDSARAPATGIANIDCIWFNSTAAMFMFPDASPEVLDYYLFQKPESWNTTSLVNTASIAFSGSQILGIEARRHPTTNEFMIIFQEGPGASPSNPNISLVRWTGTGFATVAENPLSFGLEAGGIQSEQFEWFRYDPQPNVTTVVPALNSEFTANTNIDVGGNVTDNLLLPQIPMYVNITYPNGSNFTYTASNTSGAATKFNVTFSTSVTGVFTVTFLANDSRNSLNYTEKTNFTVTAAAESPAGSKNLLSIDVINTSTGSSSQGGGFVVSSTNGKITNGTSLTYAAFDPTGLSRLNLSGIININVSLIANGSHGNYVNVTFGWILAKYNGSTMLNTTLFNSTLNQTKWNYSFNSNILPEGVYNISIYVQNVSTDVAFSSDIVVNYSRGFDIAIDRTPPNVTQFLLNDSYNVLNASNFTGGVVAFNVTVNDSTLSTEAVKVGVTGGYLANETNYTLNKNYSIYHTALSLNSILSDGFYTLKVYANDTLNNVNNTLANLSFRLDRTPPNVTFFTLNITSGSTVAPGSIIQFNASLNDSTLTVETVRFGFRSSGNNTEFNVTAIKVDYIWNVTLETSTMAEATYTVFVYGNDTLGNLNNTVGNLSFTLGTNTLPTAPLTGRPFNGSAITNRTPIFDWFNSSDADGDVISYHIQVDDNARFNNPEINVSAIQDLSTAAPGNTTWYSTIELAVDTRFYWRVRANDSTGYGTWSNGATVDGPGDARNLSNFTVDSLLSITMINSLVAFGEIVPGTEVNTSDGDPPPFRAENTGNIDANVSLNASAIFLTVPINRSAFQFKIRENESNAFSTALSATGWTNVTNSTTAAHVVNVTWRNAKNDFLVDLNLTIPSDEPSGFKTVNITFTLTRNE